MIIHAGPMPYAPATGPARPQLPADRVVTPAPSRTPPMPPVGPLAPNDAERVTRAFLDVVDQLNAQMEARNRNLSFALDRRLNTPVVAVTDKNTGELVRQIPAESVLRVAHSIENLKGVLYNQMA